MRWVKGNSAASAEIVPLQQPSVLLGSVTSGFWRERRIVFGKLRLRKSPAQNGQRQQASSSPANRKPGPPREEPCASLPNLDRGLVRAVGRDVPRGSSPYSTLTTSATATGASRTSVVTRVIWSPSASSTYKASARRSDPRLPHAPRRSGARGCRTIGAPAK